jgi:hypothetical protein
MGRRVGVRRRRRKQRVAENSEHRRDLLLAAESAESAEAVTLTVSSKAFGGARERARTEGRDSQK